MEQCWKYYSMLQNQSWIRTWMITDDEWSQESQRPGQGIIGRKDNVLHQHAVDDIEFGIGNGLGLLVKIQRLVRPAIEILGRNGCDIQYRGRQCSARLWHKGTSGANAQHEECGEFHGFWFCCFCTIDG